MDSQSSIWRAAITLVMVEKQSGFVGERRLTVELGARSVQGFCRRFGLLTFGANTEDAMAVAQRFELITPDDFIL